MGDSCVILGGRWGSGPGSVRVVLQGYNTPDVRGDDLGFRLLRTQ